MSFVTNRHVSQNSKQNGKQCLMSRLIRICTVCTDISLFLNVSSGRHRYIYTYYIYDQELIMLLDMLHILYIWSRAYYATWYDTHIIYMIKSLLCYLIWYTYYIYDQELIMLLDMIHILYIWSRAYYATWYDTHIIYMIKSLLCYLIWYTYYIYDQELIMLLDMIHILYIWSRAYYATWYDTSTFRSKSHSKQNLSVSYWTKYLFTMHGLPKSVHLFIEFLFV